MSTRDNLRSKLRKSKKYRDAYVSAHVKEVIPFQIAAMRKKLGWSQEQLAKACGLTQGVISRAEDSEYGNLTFNTVLRIAAGLDVAFVGKFMSYSEFVIWVQELSEKSVQVLTFEEEEAELAASRITEDIGVGKEEQQSEVSLPGYVLQPKSANVAPTIAATTIPGATGFGSLIFTGGIAQWTTSP